MTELEQALQHINNLEIDVFFAFLQDKTKDQVAFNLLRKSFIHKDIGFDYYQRLIVFAHQELSEGSPYEILHHNIPIAPNFFLGRQEELKQIHHFFSDTAQRQNILLISAIGGMGKTTLMQQYLYTAECQVHFQRVVYVSVERNLESAFISTVAEALGLQDAMRQTPNPKEQKELIKNALKRLAGKTLIAIDNINESEKDDLVAIKHYFEETKCKFLITTRTTPDMYERATISLDELNEQDALLLFDYHYPPTESQSPQEATQALLAHIHRHTLLTELLAKVGKKRGLSSARLLETLKEQDSENPNLQASFKSSELGGKITIDAHARSTGKLPEATLHQYILSLFEPERLNDTGKEMARFFSVLPAEDIPIGDLCMLWRVEQAQQIAFENNLDELKQSGWIQGKHTKRQHEQAQNLAYKMHPLVQEVVYEKLRPDINNVRPLVITTTQMLALPLNVSHRFQPYAKSIIDKLNLLNNQPKNL